MVRTHCLICKLDHHLSKGFENKLRPVLMEAGWTLVVLKRIYSLHLHVCFTYIPEHPFSRLSLRG
jgi:hypothetical protein